MTAASGRRAATLAFNQELVLGEVGSLLMAYAAAYTTAHFTAKPAYISASTIVGTLLGGTLFWCAARILNQRAQRSLSPGKFAQDISFFTPAAITLGFVVYDPAIYLVSHRFLVHGSPVWLAVAAGQFTAFSLFLASMNVYRLILRKVSGKEL